MNSPGAIRHKLKQVIYRHLKRKLEQELAEVPENCVYNDTVMDPYSQANDRFPVPIHVCIHSDVGERLCDPRWGGNEKASGCPYFQVQQDKDSIKESFKEFMRSAPLHEIAAEYPDVAALLWVLDEDAPDRENPIHGGFSSVTVGPVTVLAETPEEALEVGKWLRLQKEEAEEVVAIANAQAQDIIEREARLQEEINALRDENQALREKESESVPEETALTDPGEPDTKKGLRAWVIRLLGGTP